MFLQFKKALRRVVFPSNLNHGLQLNGNVSYAYQSVVDMPCLLARNASQRRPVCMTLFFC